MKFEIKLMTLLSFFALVLGFASLYFEAFVLTTLWRWIAIPIFPTLPTLDIPTAMVYLVGIGFIINIIKVIMRRIKASEEENNLESFRKKVDYILVRHILIPLALLAIGWVIHTYLLV